MAEPTPSGCPACGASFSCGVETDRCWCESIPVDGQDLRRKTDARDGCLCPSCLREVSSQPLPGPT